MFAIAAALNVCLGPIIPITTSGYIMRSPLSKLKILWLATAAIMDDLPGPCGDLAFAVLQENIVDFFNLYIKTWSKTALGKLYMHNEDCKRIGFALAEQWRDYVLKVVRRPLESPPTTEIDFSNLMECAVFKLFEEHGILLNKQYKTLRRLVFVKLTTHTSVEPVATSPRFTDMF